MPPATAVRFFSYSNCSSLCGALCEGMKDICLVVSTVALVNKEPSVTDVQTVCVRLFEFENSVQFVFIQGWNWTFGKLESVLWLFCLFKKKKT